MNNLKSLVLLSVLLAISCQDHVYDVIVIGAGVSGVVSAHELHKEGKDVLILEGRSRQGGRLHTDKEKFGMPIDLGGAWIHGDINNSVFDYAKELNAKLFLFDWDKRKYLRQKFSKLKKNDLYDTIGEEFLDWLKQTVESQLEENEDKSMKHFLDIYLDEKELSSEKSSILLSYLYVEIEGTYAIDLNKISAKNYEGKYVEGDDFLPLDGYWSLFEPLTEDLEIKYDSKVVEIDQSDSEEPVVVVLEDETEYHAHKVIVTVPLGVLKKNIISFHPELSDAKKEAIEKLGFGCMEKIIVEFKEAFWQKEKTNFVVLQNPVSAISLWINVHAIVEKKILIFLVGKVDSVDWEKYFSVSEEALREKLIEEISKYYPDEDIEIEKVVTTNWCEDPFSFGSYTSYAVGSNSQMIEEFEHPEGRLYFAGEHTDVKGFETVTGAFNSGKRAAKQILDN